MSVNGLDSKVAPFQLSPYKPISLWDMTTYFAKRIIRLPPRP